MIHLLGGCLVKLKYWGPHSGGPHYSELIKKRKRTNDSTILSYLGDIIANVSGGVARGEQASDVQSAHLDLVALTHLPGLSSDTHPCKIYP